MLNQIAESKTKINHRKQKRVRIQNKIGNNSLGIGIATTRHRHWGLFNKQCTVVINPVLS